MNCDLSSFESVRLAILDDDSIDEEIKNNFKSSCYIPDFDEEISKTEIEKAKECVAEICGI